MNKAVFELQSAAQERKVFLEFFSWEEKKKNDSGGQNGLFMAYTNTEKGHAF